MAKVHIGYDQHGVVGVDDEFIHFVFDVVVAMTKLSDHSEVGLVVTDDAFMRKLNRQYRGKDQPTNVLSFVYAEINPKDLMPKGDEHYLGDIYISHASVAAQARTLGVRDKDEFTRLFVHGLFHLAGIHHDDNAAAIKMEGLEDEALRHIATAG